MLRKLLENGCARPALPTAVRSNVLRIFPTRNVTSDVAQQEDPNFHEMTEFFIENARYYVEERLANRADGPGKRPTPPEQKRQAVKGRHCVTDSLCLTYEILCVCLCHILSLYVLLWSI